MGPRWDGAVKSISGAAAVALLICVPGAAAEPRVTPLAGGPAMASLTGVGVSPITGHVYVNDARYKRVLEFTADGILVRKWGSQGNANGQFLDPIGLAVAPSGDVYVMDEGNQRVQEFTASGTFVRKWGTGGAGDGQFNSPFGIAVGPNGHVLVADTDNNRIQEFLADGTFVRKWGQLGSGNGDLSQPQSLVVAPGGEIYVADTVNHRIEEFDSNAQFVRKWGALGPAPGQFHTPDGIAVGSGGDVYVADNLNNRVQQFTSTGAFVRQWGGEGSNDSQFRFDWGIAVGPTGDVYTSEIDGHRMQQFTANGDFIRKWGSFSNIDREWGTFVSGLGASASSRHFFVADGEHSRVQEFTAAGSPAHSIGSPDVTNPTGVGVSPANGDVYVADSSYGLVKRFNSSGVFQSNVFGTTDPEQVAVSPLNGDLFVSYPSENEVWQFTSAGVLIRVVGDCCSADGEFVTPEQAAVAPNGHLYVADTGNNRVQEFTENGVFVRKWGTTGAAPGQFDQPSGIAVAPTGAVFVADTNNRRVQAFSPTGAFRESIPLSVAPVSLAATGRSSELLALAGLYVFRVADVTPPSIGIDLGPAEDSYTNDDTPTFGLTSPEPGVTFRCRVDGEPFAPCSGGNMHTTDALSDGQHTFQVRGTDAAGNESDPYTRRFTVDTLAPTVSVSGPSKTTSRTPKFTLSANEPATFQCQIDTGSFVPCASPYKTPKLKPGNHALTVLADDRAGNQSAPTQVSVKIKRS